jgi:hypothetical protein
VWKAATCAFRHEIQNESRLWILAPTNVTGRAIRRTAFPHAGRTDERIIARERRWPAKRNHAKTSGAQNFEAGRDILKHSARAPFRPYRPVAGPRRSDDQPVDQAILVAVVGGQKDVLVPPGL